MDVRPGYKQTDFGLIPSDWNVESFDKLGSVIDGDRGANYPSGRDFGSAGHCLFLNAGNVTKDGFRFCDCAFISRERDERLSKGKLKQSDIVLTTRGTVGNFAYFDKAVPFENLRINSGMVILRNASSTLDTSFLYIFLQSHLLEIQIERLTFGSAQPQLTVKGISTLAIVVPSLPEQRAIAEALSDIDVLLQSLDRLIAKKCDLKQAAMQQLLTGQTRLPDFHGEWDSSTLKYAAEICTGINKPISEMGRGTLYVTVQDLYDGTSIRTARLGRIRVSATEILTRSLETGDVVFGKSSVKRDGIGYPSQFLGCGEPVVLSGFTYRARAPRSRGPRLSLLCTSVEQDSAVADRQLASIRTDKH